MSEFATGFYDRWRKNRFQAIVAHYGPEFFKGKKVLELAAANGDFGNMFHELGARVKCFEGRESNFKLLKEKYPHLDAHVVDLDNENIQQFGFFYDIVLHVGLLYHLLNMEQSLKDSMAISNHVILETEVMDSDQDGYFVTTEDASRMTSSLDGVATRPTNTMLKRIIEDNGWEIEHPKDPKSINTTPYIYDWTPNNHGLLYGARVLWFLRRKDG
jgi:hypothetical protein